MKILSLFLLFLLLNGVFGEESVSVMTGGSVTLHTHVDIDDIDFLKWSFNGVRIAHMQAHDYVQILRERIQLNDRTGDLTITDMRTTDTGLYELNIISYWDRPTRIFSVTVSDDIFDVKTDEVESLSVTEGDDAILRTDVTVNEYVSMAWYFNGVRIAKLGGDPSNTCTDVRCNTGAERFRWRLELDHNTGTLTITNIEQEHSGLYEVKIINSRSHESNGKKFIVCVDEDKSHFSTCVYYTSPLYLLISVASVVTILVLSIVLCCICCKCRKRHRDGVSGVESNEMKTIQDGVKTIKVKTGNSVILDTGITEVQTCDLIQWKMVQLGNSSDPFILLATMTKTNKKKPLNDGVRTFKDRLQLDHQTGNLTITNASITDTGVYKLEITDPRNKISKAFIVTVSENGGDESEDINSPLMRDAQQH